MQLHEVGEILEVFDVEEVKARVVDGWMLIAVVPVAVPTSGQKSACCYVMGKRKPGVEG
ncbi:hypothetical protein [Pseudomonas sp. R5(2019)]|uniref:hypothetical protein n=1 Tax=Pseudomonas sp. R5(2019) TaxID=2697566 RepID=UPI001412D4D6|nr:hypothetical protein [Pseudomonas sp. R5(2019)]NBA98136.1 hypothetical protein [Pseudomonas sp. R5(2019)]